MIAKISRIVAQSGSASSSGGEGRWFKSSRSDHFSSLLSCEKLNSRRCNSPVADGRPPPVWRKRLLFVAGRRVRQYPSPSLAVFYNGITSVCSI